MDVAEIAAVLGLSVDEAQWNHALELIEKVKKGTEELGHVGKKAGEEAAEGWKKFQEIAETTEHFLEAYVGYEGIKSLGEMTEQIVSQTMELQHLSERYGVTVETLQNFDYMAKLSGTSLHSVTMAMQRMEFGLRATSKAAGMHGAAGALQKLGINATEFRKAAMPEQLGMLADKFEKMADPNQKIAMATQLGGRGMVTLIPLLSKGREKMEELAKEAQELGYNLDPKQAEAYEEQQAKLGLQWDGIKTRIVEMLLPALQKLADFLGVVMTYFREHPDQLRIALELIGAVAAFTAAAMFMLGVRTLFAKGKFAELLGTLGPVVAIILATVEAVKWTNENLGRTPAIIVGVIGALIALRTVLRSVKGEGLISSLGGIAKNLGGKLLGGAAVGEAGAVAGGAGVAEGAGAAAAGGAGIAGGAATAVMLLPLAIAGYVGYKGLEGRISHDQTPYYASDADAEYMRKHGDNRNMMGDIHITAPVEIHTEASAEDIKDVLENHLDDHIRNAHKNMKDE